MTKLQKQNGNFASTCRRQHRSALWSCLELLLRSILLVATLTSFRAVNASYAISISAGTEECFLFLIPSNVGKTSTVSGSFEVLHDDLDSNELEVKITDLKTSSPLYEVPLGTLEGDFKLENLKASSKFKICFNVRYHNPARTLDDGESGPDGERASHLAEKAWEIHQDWDILQDHFDFLRNREGIHFEMNAGIMRRLAHWTYIEAALVIIMAVGQVMYWKKFFEKRRYL